VVQVHLGQHKKEYPF